MESESMRRLGAIFDKIVDVFVALAGILIILDAVAVAIDVILRKVAHINLPTLFQITEYTIVWMTFLGTTWVMRKQGHVRVDILTARLKPKPQTITAIAGYTFGAILVGIMAYFTTRLTIYDYQTNLTLSGVARPLKWPIEMIIPIGYFMFFIQLLRIVYHNIKSLKTQPISKPVSVTKSI